jgi:hypothetical protein
VTAVYRCDGCGSIIEESDGRVELSVFEPEGIEPDADETIEPSASDLPAEAHFCQLGCVAAWAMDRAINTTT